MKHAAESPAPKTASKRLTKAQRRRQLLDMALVIIREEGADRLTLGHLAARAGVSKPITYEHFGTRAGLLIDLYKLLDQQQADALREALRRDPRNLAGTADVLATSWANAKRMRSPRCLALGLRNRSRWETDSYAVQPALPRYKRHETRCPAYSCMSGCNQAAKNHCRRGSPRRLC
ncbi:MAG: TetR/AcrR family transcriptional regulator [Hymenobacter sp.]|nr:TetR/AcrR family transcriptional regulator [Hymenobacter sp.]